MKTLRIATALLFTVIAATACTGAAESPMEPSAESSQVRTLDGIGMFGGGTNAP